MKKSACKWTAFLLSMILLMASCKKNPDGENPPSESPEGSETVEAFGSDLKDLGAYDGYFEGESTDIEVTCLSGSDGCYKLTETTLTFTELAADSVYSISGTLRGNIVIDIGDERRLDLEMQGLSLVSSNLCPIFIKSGDEVSLTAKKDTKNYVYDEREEVLADNTTVFDGAIFSNIDLEICGKGSLTVISENNNGIHTKDDLQVKNLTLLVSCRDNALKGNDSVELKSGTTTLIATAGDGIKTSNSEISEKGNQKGTVSVLGGSHAVFAACDGIDAAYDVTVEGADTILKIYTDKYSSYSNEITAITENIYYIRYTSNLYHYSVRYYNSDSDSVWVNAEYHSTVSGGRSSYYYYSFPKKTDYEKMQVFIYSSDMDPSQDKEYLVASEYLTPHESYDTFALIARGNFLSYRWTNYTTTVQERPGGPGGMGGMQDGNTDKSDRSTKGIKAANEILISDGSVTVRSYDDALHANNDEALENGATPTGNLTVSGGKVSVSSNDDGLHADGALTVSGGNVTVSNSYEGAEGTTVTVSGGSLSIYAEDDGINATATSGSAVTVSNGTLYVYCSGDGIDSNSRTAYAGILFSGGNTVVISTSNGNSAIDTEQGYAYTGGSVLAIMPSGGMTNEATHCQNFSSVATSKSVSLSAGSFLTVSVNGKSVVTLKVPSAISGKAIYLGSASASISNSSSTSATPDANGVCWD